jgi:uncharacterized protein
MIRRLVRGSRFNGVLSLAIALSILMLAACTVAPKPPSTPPAATQPPAAAPSGGSYGLRPSTVADDIMIAPLGIQMSDGKKLAADLYLPQKGGPFPVILIQTPYNGSRYNPVLARELAGENVSTTGGASTVDFGGLGGSMFASTDYAVVIVDWRGRFGSSNAGPIGTPAQRALDCYDTVEWIVSQPWCNGKVGGFGSSALGQVQFVMASKQPPHLTCIMPRVSGYTTSYGDYYPGGVLRQEYMDGLVAATWGALSDAIKAHPLDDGWYNYKDAANAKDIKVPGLFIGGWWDINDMPAIFTSFISKADAKTADSARMLICPTSHTLIAKDEPEGDMVFPNAGKFARDEQKKFFDYWLRGKDPGYTSANKITYYQMGINEWRTSAQWPPAGMKQVNYYLDDGGVLTTAAPSSNTSPKQFVFDPKNPVPTAGGNTFNPPVSRGAVDQSKNVESRKDVLVFSSGELNDDVTIDGEVSVLLYISSDSADTDVAIRLTDVYPDGHSILVRDGIQRASHIEGDKVEKFLTPGTVYPITVKTWSVGQTFLKGHRIRLDISASNYPRFGVNNGSEDRGKAPKVITDTLYFDAPHPSSLVLPVVPK